MSLLSWVVLLAPIGAIFCGGLWFMFKLATAPTRNTVEIHAKYHADHYKTIGVHAIAISSLQRQADDHAKSDEIKFKELSDMCAEIREDIKELLRR
mgnify:CR=1 FL=1